MKLMKQMAILVLLIGMMQGVNAQARVVKVYPKHGTVVTALVKPKVIVHKRSKFYFADGVWYRANRRGYVVTSAPVGLRVKTLPRARKVVVVKGKRYYRYRGITYQKRRGHFYVVTL